MADPRQRVAMGKSVSVTDRHPGGVPARLLVMAMLATAIQIGGCFAASVWQPAARPLDALSLGLLLAGPMALLASRRSPVAALAVNAAVVMLYLGSGYPLAPMMSLVFALLNAALRGYRWQGLFVASGFYLGLLAINWHRSDPLGWWTLLGIVGWLLVLLTIGELARARHARVAKHGGNQRKVCAGRVERKEVRLRDDDRFRASGG